MKMIFVLVTVSYIASSVQGQQYVNDVVICRSSTQRTIQCGFNQIIDIQSVTVALLSNTGECSVNLISSITQLLPACKRSWKGPNPDGKKVYSRCHGELSCPLDGSVVDTARLHQACDLTYQHDARSNVLWFNYSCHHVDSTSPSVGILPLSENTETRGLEVEIFSPYYPCFVPRPDQGYATLDCTVTPLRKNTGSWVTYTVTPKYVEIRENIIFCRDLLHFEHGPHSNRLTRYYCGDKQHDSEWWNDDVITHTTPDEFHIKYTTDQNGGSGAKFWLIVNASEHGMSVEVSITCTGQEKIPQLPSDSTCSPFPLTTTTTTTTTTATMTAPSTTNSEPTTGTNSGLLFGALGGVLVLVLIIACAVIFLFCVIRKRKRETDDENKVPPVTPPRKTRPKSIQMIVAMVSKKRKAPNNPYEEADPEAAEEVKKPAIKPKPQKQQKHPRPNSLMKMAALIKNGRSTKRKAPNPSEDQEGKADNVAVVGPLDVYATVDKKQKKKKKTAGASQSQEKVVNNYVIPELGKNDTDETIMCENDDLYQYTPLKTDNKDKNKDDNKDNGQEAGYSEINDLANGRPGTILYEDVKENTEENPYENETVTVSLPDDHPNEA